MGGARRSLQSLFLCPHLGPQVSVWGVRFSAQTQEWGRGGGGNRSARRLPRVPVSAECALPLRRVVPLCKAVPAGPLRAPAARPQPPCPARGRGTSPSTQRGRPRSVLAPSLEGQPGGAGALFSRHLGPNPSAASPRPLPTACVVGLVLTPHSSQAPGLRRGGTEPPAAGTTCRLRAVASRGQGRWAPSLSRKGGPPGLGSPLDPRGRWGRQTRVGAFLKASSDR